MKHPVRAIVVVLTVAATIQAHDLKAALQDLAPAGKVMRLVYAKGGTPQEDNGYGNFSFTGTAVYSVSSEDGVIRKIYPSGTGTGNYHCINITNDGTRVVFWNAAASQVVVVSYGGTFVRSFSPLNYGATGMYDYYYDAATNTDWAILSDNTTFVKVNVDQPNSAPVTIATSTQVGDWNTSDDVAGTISDDGKYLCGDNNGTKGVIDLTKTTRTFISADPGCHSMIRPGTPVQMSQNTCGNCTCTGSLTHGGPTVFGLPSSGSQMVRSSFYCVRNVMDAFVQQNPSFSTASCPFFDRSDGLRWLRNRDYFSTLLYGSFGPCLWRTTDNKWTYIEHDVQCTSNAADGAGAVYMADLDGQTAASFPTTSTVRQEAGHRPAGLFQQGAEARIYSIDGRLVADPSHAVSHNGIVIRQLTNGTVARICR